MAYVDSSPLRDSGSTKKDQKKPSARLNKYWKEIEAYGKSTMEWKDQGENIVKLYLDQTKTAATPRKFALLWSNIETLKPAIYAKTPTVLCSRRYKDPHPVGRVAAEILERATNCTFDIYKYDEVFRMVRDDRLLVARGQAWVRYEADFKKAKDKDGEEYEKVAGEKICLDYVHWCDFGHNVAGTWRDVWLVWRKVYKTREENKERFGQKIAEQLTYSAKVDPDGKQEQGEHVACIYELWDKKKNETVFISRDYPDFLEEPDKPPLSFRDFFPCPEPCYGSKTGKSLIPTPDYCYYKDQAMEINDLTAKIANLTDWLILKGFVPAGPTSEGGEAVKILIENLQKGLTSNEVTIVPVESWAGYTEKGGASKIIDWLPLEKVIQALQGAVETRNQLIQDVYQITGIADILRGQTDPDETLGAQELKAQTGARRVRNSKDELARFCRDVAQLVAEVVAEQFQPQTLAAMTGYKYVPGQVIGVMPEQQGAQDAPSGKIFDDQVLALLRSDMLRSFLIDTETDSTIQPDEDVEKQRRVEFVTAIGQFMKEALPAVQMAPPIVPMLKETLMFLARGFRAGRNVEDVFEQSMQQLQQHAMQAAQQPNPETVKAQAEVQKIQMQAQADQQKVQADAAAKQQEMQFKAQELELKQQEMALKIQFEQQKMALEKEKMGMEHQRAQMEFGHAQQKMAMEGQMQQQAMQHQAQKGEQEIAHAQAMSQIEKTRAQKDEQRAGEKHQAEMAAAQKPKVTTINRDGEGRMAGLVTQ